MITEKLTNEERKVAIYATGNKPTNPEEVNEGTPLENLNLNWTEKELPERKRTKHVHRLHPYLGKFIPQIVEIFLRKYFHSGQTVLDPFSGSGTTLVQANELGINSIGFDISEFNVLLAEVKTRNYNIDTLRRETFDLLENLQGVFSNGQPKLFDDFQLAEDALLTTNEYLNTWFAPTALRELLAYKKLLENYEYRDLFRIILSRSARSARLTTHYDLDWPKKPQTEPYYCYKHDRTCQPTTDALKFLIRYSIDTIKRVEAFSHIRSEASVKIVHTDSRMAVCDWVDGIITSPPYVGIIDYHAQHNYAYNLIGLTDNSDHEIGPAKRGNSKAAKEEYKIAMATVLKNTSNFVKTGGKIIVIAGDKDNLYPEISEMANLKLESIVERHVNRRTGRRSSEFFESIFIYTK